MKRPSTAEHRGPPRGDRGDDQVAYAHEIASEVGGRESAIGRDDRREMITGDRMTQPSTHPAKDSLDRGLEHCKSMARSPGKVKVRGELSTGAAYEL